MESILDTNTDPIPPSVADLANDFAQLYQLNVWLLDEYRRCALHYYEKVKEDLRVEWDKVEWTNQESAIYQCAEGLCSIHRVHSPKQVIHYLVIGPYRNQTVLGELSENALLVLIQSQGTFLAHSIKTTCELDMKRRESNTVSLQLNEAQQLARMGSWKLDHKTGALFWSEEVYRLFGLPLNTPLTYADFLNMVLPGERDAVDQAFQNHLRNKLDYEITHRAQLPNGQIRFLREKCWSEFDAHGDPMVSVGTVQDITENVLKDQRIEEMDANLMREKLTYFHLVGNIPGMVYRQELSGRRKIFYVSPQVKKITGYSVMDVLDKDFQLRTIIFPEDLPRAEAILNRAIAEKSTYSASFRIRTKDGQTKWVREEGSIISEDDQVVELQGVIFDVTEEKEAEMLKLRFAERLEKRVEEQTKELQRVATELQDSLESERQLSEMKGRFTSMMTHQIKTPLSIISTKLELIEMKWGYMTEEQRGESLSLLHRDIEQEVEKINKLVRNVMELGRAENLIQQRAPKKLSLTDLVKEVIGEFSSLDAREIRMEVQGDVRPNTLDPFTLHEAIANVLSNALKYSVGAAAPIVHLRFGDRYTEIAVQDFGIGIPENEISKLFQPFFRASNALSFEGTGIGTSVIQDFVRANGGTVEVKSKLGEGTTFTMRFEQ